MRSTKFVSFFRLSPCTVADSWDSWNDSSTRPEVLNLNTKLISYLPLTWRSTNKDFSAHLEARHVVVVVNAILQVRLPGVRNIVIIWKMESLASKAADAYLRVMKEFPARLVS